ncbi:nardilysin [Capsaspora owczarzaki ATCC 30864]|uniref:Nardilysin n=1 Tax=Capsaspora owczarzaki (strain ATCC 30864) TaxID=595528 RepID=A0A0D2VQ60_CAPO3|nr:nardilysin [Capsaspora owczarzaki ATCC 30864]KJE92712.1 nardilysin [Capsaspora owczarzaki ATCC 30864]|eukprot:XP_004363355.2 nardilysin [Capsaspora owczarzaki ATCC 30864]
MQMLRLPGGPLSVSACTVKSASDPYDYRTIRLPNGLVALLIHDPHGAPAASGASPTAANGNADAASGAGAPGSSSAVSADPGKRAKPATTASSSDPQGTAMMQVDDDGDDDDDEFETESDEGQSGSSSDDDDDDDDDQDSEDEDEDQDEPEERQEDSDEESAGHHRRRKTGDTDAQEAKRRSAAAMCVGVGSFSDPPEVQGLAHFLEHMLFMGSERFPDENAFDAFIRKNGGSDNASTECENTIFQFDIGPEHFHTALDIFAQFFVQPLMKADTMERERNAVDTEFAMAESSDSSRKLQFLCSAGRSGHPVSQFSWGNAKSLLEMPVSQGIDVREQLVAFHKKHYHAGVMRLCLLGQASLDTMEGWVREIFAAIPPSPMEAYAPLAAALQLPLPENGNAEDAHAAGLGLPVLAPMHAHASLLGSPPPFGGPWDAFTPETFCTVSYAEPIKQLHELNLTWLLPPLSHAYRAKPLYYISELVGHEGPGSIYSQLTQLGWASALYAGNGGTGYEANSSFYTFDCTVVLTDSGVEHIPEILLFIFQYLQLLRDEGPLQRLFAEQQAIAAMSFRFGEPIEPIDYVEMLSGNMQYFPEEDVVCGSDLYFDFDPAAINSILDMLAPQTARIFILSNRAAHFAQLFHGGHAGGAPAAEGETRVDTQFESIEPWFKLPYTTRPLPEAWIEQWSNCGRHPSFFLPPANAFIATDFNLVTGDENQVQVRAADYMQHLPSRLLPSTQAAAHLATARAAQAATTTVVPPTAVSSPAGSTSKNEPSCVTSMDVDGQSQPVDQPRPPLYPVLISQTALWNLWHRRDTVFGLPRASVYMHITGPGFNQTARQVVLTDLHVTVLDTITKQFSYAADVAEVSFSLQHVRQGLFLKVTGFSHKLPVLFERLIQCIANVGMSIRDEDFELARNRMLRRYQNASIKPDKLARTLRLDLLQQRRFTIAERVLHLEGGAAETVLMSRNARNEQVEAEHVASFGRPGLSSTHDDTVAAVTLTELRDHITASLARIFCDVLVQGNMNCNQALALMASYREALHPVRAVSPATPSSSTTSGMDCSQSPASANLEQTAHAAAAAAATIPAIPARMTPRDFPQDCTTVLPPGSIYLRTRGQNPNDDNSVVEVYYQCASLPFREVTVSVLLECLMEEPCFDVLRTKEQLGYDVSCCCRYTGGITGFGFQVQAQSSKFTVAHIDSRVETFIREVYLPQLEGAVRGWDAKYNPRPVITSVAPARAASKGVKRIATKRGSPARSGAATTTRKPLASAVRTSAASTRSHVKVGAGRASGAKAAKSTSSKVDSAKAQPTESDDDDDDDDDDDNDDEEEDDDASDTDASASGKNDGAPASAKHDAEMCANFESHRAALISNKLQQVMSLTEEVDRNWNEVADRDYLYDRLERESAELQTITPHEVLAFVKQYLVPSSQRRKCTVMVVGKSELTNDEDGRLCIAAINQAEAALPLEARAPVVTHLTEQSMFAFKELQSVTPAVSSLHSLLLP